MDIFLRPVKDEWLNFAALGADFQAFPSVVLKIGFQPQPDFALFGFHTN